MTAAAPLAVPDTLSNRRNFDRTRMNRPVEIYSDAGMRLGVFTLKDISARGARIALGSELAIPETIVLCLSEEGIRWRCEVVRTNDQEIGVEFL